MRDAMLALRVDAWVLPALLTWPVIGALLTYAFGRPAPRDGGSAFAAWRDARVLTMAALAGEAVLALGLWFVFDPAVTGWQAVVDLPWIPKWGARVTYGVDGMSLVLVTMTALLMPLAVLGSWSNVREEARRYYGLLLLVTAGVVGVFVTLDLLLFYIFWELVLVSTYFMIGIAGGVGRTGASRRYFALTNVASLLMLVAIVVLWVASGSRTFNIDGLLAASRGALSAAGQLYLFGGFFLAFAVKSAFFPLHGWLPDAQHEAPTSAAVALGIEAGTYGILRFAIPLFPAAATHPTLRLAIIAVSVTGILYAALVAVAQPDLKRVLSYASIGHLGFVMLGIFTLSVQSLQGALVVMLSHGVSLGALFLLVGMLQDRRANVRIGGYRGVARVVPLLAGALAFVALSAVGLPGTGGFVGALLVLRSAYQAYPVAAVLAAAGVALAAAYLVRALRRLVSAPLGDPDVASLPDLDWRERIAMGVFAVAIVWVGVAPGAVLRRVEGPTQRIVEQVTRGAATPPADLGAPPAR